MNFMLKKFQLLYILILIRNLIASKISLVYMALRIIDHGTDEYTQMVNLRNLLLRKPLGLSFDEEELEKEKNDILLGCFDDSKLEGCCLLTAVGSKTVRLRTNGCCFRLTRKRHWQSVVTIC